MAKNSIDAYGALGKTNVLMFDPEALHLVIDEKSPLYDERVHLPVSEPMVLNIMYQGVLEPVIINKNTETGVVEVVAGRQRVKNAREANRRLRERGCEPIHVPAIVRRDDGASLAGVMVSENEVRESDTPIGRAKKMRQMLGLGKTEADLAVLFGCSKQTVDNTLALLDCTAAVRDAVDAGQIGVGHARAFAKLDPSQQREKVAELVSIGRETTGHTRARKQREVVSPGLPKMRTRAQITTERDASSGDRRAALDWVLGNVTE